MWNMPSLRANIFRDSQMQRLRPKPPSPRRRPNRSPSPRPRRHRLRQRSLPRPLLLRPLRLDLRRHLLPRLLRQQRAPQRFRRHLLVPTQRQHRFVPRQRRRKRPAQCPQLRKLIRRRQCQQPVRNRAKLPRNPALRSQHGQLYRCVLTAARAVFVQLLQVHPRLGQWVLLRVSDSRCGQGSPSGDPRAPARPRACVLLRRQGRHAPELQCVRVGLHLDSRSAPEAAAVQVEVAQDRLPSAASAPAQRAPRAFRKRSLASLFTRANLPQVADVRSSKRDSRKASESCIPFARAQAQARAVARCRPNPSRR
jgi:hypothetical protein